MKLQTLIAIICCLLLLGSGKVYGAVHAEPFQQTVEQKGGLNTLFGTAIDFFDEAVVPVQMVNEMESIHVRRSILFVKLFTGVVAKANLPLTASFGYFYNWQHTLQAAEPPIYLSLQVFLI